MRFNRNCDDSSLSYFVYILSYSELDLMDWHRDRLSYDTRAFANTYAAKCALDPDIVLFCFQFVLSNSTNSNSNNNNNNNHKNGLYFIEIRI